MLKHKNMINMLHILLQMNFHLLLRLGVMLVCVILIGALRLLRLELLGRLLRLERLRQLGCTRAGGTRGGTQATHPSIDHARACA